MRCYSPARLLAFLLALALAAAPLTGLAGELNATQLAAEYEGCLQRCSQSPPRFSCENYCTCASGLIGRYFSTEEYDEIARLSRYGGELPDGARERFGIIGQVCAQQVMKSEQR